MRLGLRSSSQRGLTRKQRDFMTFRYTPPMPTGDRGDPLNAMNFVVGTDGIPSSAFLTVCGIEADVAVIDYRPGNDKVLGVRKLPGEAKSATLC
jgi:hypothetical protein